MTPGPTSNMSLEALLLASFCEWNARCLLIMVIHQRLIQVEVYATARTRCFLSFSFQRTNHRLLSGLAISILALPAHFDSTTIISCIVIGKDMSGCQLY